MGGRASVVVVAMVTFAVGGWSWGTSLQSRYGVEEGANRARYLVREQLLGRDLPNDAVGETNGVTGSVVLDGEGHVDPETSVIRIDMASLRTDSDRRDNYVRRRVLLTDEHAETALRITSIEGLPWPLPTEGTVPFRLEGELTVVGTTRPTAWTGEMAFTPGRIAGTARTAFTFEEFGITKPRVRSVLSVADTIRLEYDFSFVPG